MLFTLSLSHRAGQCTGHTCKMRDHAPNTFITCFSQRTRASSRRIQLERQCDHDRFLESAPAVPKLLSTEELSRTRASRLAMLILPLVRHVPHGNDAHQHGADQSDHERSRDQGAGAPRLGALLSGLGLLVALLAVDVLLRAEEALGLGGRRGRARRRAMAVLVVLSGAALDVVVDLRERRVLLADSALSAGCCCRRAPRHRGLLGGTHVTEPALLHRLVEHDVVVGGCRLGAWSHVAVAAAAAADALAARAGQDDGYLAQRSPKKSGTGKQRCLEDAWRRRAERLVMVDSERGGAFSSHSASRTRGCALGWSRGHLIAVSSPPKRESSPRATSDSPAWRTPASSAARHRIAPAATGSTLSYRAAQVQCRPEAL